MATETTDWKRDYLYRMFSHHTRNKEKENYVVNAIWARLDDLRIKPVTQQYVHRPDGYALIDLYFPQINYAIECDEEYHKDNVERDAEREVDLYKALASVEKEGLTICRIKACESIEEIHKNINKCVEEVRQRIADKGDGLQPWLSPEEEWAPIRERGILRPEDGYAFESIADVCKKCFGKPEGYTIQRAFFNIRNDEMLWCPKLAVELPDGKLKARTQGWMNLLSPDWETIAEYNVDDRSKNSAVDERPRITFAKSKTERGEDAYRFIGVYQFERHWYKRRIYKRVATEIKLDQDVHRLDCSDYPA